MPDNSEENSSKNHLATPKPYPKLAWWRRFFMWYVCIGFIFLFLDEIGQWMSKHGMKFPMWLSHCINFVMANQMEGCFWIALGLFIYLARFESLKKIQTHRLLFLVVLVIFGISDFVEASTGAWWQPWWLLLWKGSCVGLLLWLLITTNRDKERSSD